ncbi:MAG: YihA family ribosome biogenesis GTP-binding protein [Bacteroidales bacterium]|nr:YihA family ribosome biogenesis GTP-binding protein [Candidatus Colimorpha onthohippi]
MEIASATFIVSNSDYRKCPLTGLPEYAFIGRSNVGKSSLINMLTGVKGLAKTSGRPGKTQLINHFLINNQWYLVDLPGYGYARISKEARERWEKMIRNYFLNRTQLTNVFVLVDSRIPPQKSDLDFINFLGVNGIPLSIVFTKTDKEKQREITKNIKAFKDAMMADWEELPTMILTSSATGYGRDNILDLIAQINETL